MALPWSVNKFFSTQINNSNSVSGTYKSVSLQVAGNTELNNTTVSSIGVNKNNDGSTYKLDVNGNINIAGTIYVNGTPFDGGSILNTNNVWTGTNTFTQLNIGASLSSNSSVTSGVFSFTALYPSATFQTFQTVFGNPFTMTSILSASTLAMPINGVWTFVLSNISQGLITVNPNIVGTDTSVYVATDFANPVSIGNGFGDNIVLTIKKMTNNYVVVSCVNVSNTLGGTIPAINAGFMNLTSDNTAGSYPLTFSKTASATGNALYIDNSTTPLTYNPSTGQLAVESISGNTISASSISIVGKSAIDTLITVATSVNEYVWAYNQPQNILFTGTVEQTMFLPSVTTANLGTTITIFKSTGTMSIQTQNTDPAEFIQTENNEQVEIYPVSSLVTVIALTAISTVGSVWAVIYSQSPNRNISATLTDAQTFTTGAKIFNTNTTFSASRTVTANSQFVFNTTLPTSTLTPNSGTQLITKTYADGIVGRSNAWTNTNSFNTALPTSTITPTTANQFTTKSYVDGLIPTTSLLTLNNSWSGTNTFNNNLSMGSSGYFLPYYPSTNTSYRMGLNSMLYQTANSTNNLVWGSNTLQGVSAQGANNQVRQGVYIGNNVGQGLYVIDSDLVNNNCDNNVVIGHSAITSSTILARNNVIIGANSGSGLINIKDCCFIGTNIATNSGFFADRCVVIGSGNCPTISETSLSTVVGSNNALAGLANSSTIYGANNLTVGTANGSGVLIGSQCGQNLATDAGAIIIGARSGNLLTTGFVNQIYGSDSDITTSTATNVSLHGANIAYTGGDNTFYIGGNWAGLYQDLVVAKKNRFLCNRQITTNNPTLVSEDPEQIVIANNTVLNINLLTPETANIGTRFTFVKSYSPYVSVTITASAGLTIQSPTTNTNTYTFGSDQGFLTLICIATTGTSWIVSNQQGTSSASSNATTVSVTTDNTNGNYFIPFVKTTGATNNILYVDNAVSQQQLTYNPSTNLLNAICGVAQTSNQIITANTTTATQQFITFVETTGSANPNQSSMLYYFPSTGQLNAEIMVSTSLLTTTATIRNPSGMNLSPSTLRTYLPYGSYPLGNTLLTGNANFNTQTILYKYVKIGALTASPIIQLPLTTSGVCFVGMEFVFRRLSPTGAFATFVQCQTGDVVFGSGNNTSVGPGVSAIVISASSIMGRMVCVSKNGVDGSTQGVWVGFTS